MTGSKGKGKARDTVLAGPGGSDLAQGSNGAKIKGVRICCDGEMSELGCNRLEPVEISAVRFSTVGETAKVSSFSKALGEPLLVWRYEYDANDKTRSKMRTDADRSNKNRYALLLSLKKRQIFYNWDTPSSLNMGSVVVMRQDGEDLNIERFELFCRFLRYYTSRQILFTFNAYGANDHTTAMIFQTMNWRFIESHRDRLMAHDLD